MNPTDSNIPLRLSWISLAVSTVLALSACGGDDNTNPAPDPEPTTVPVPVTVLDGALQNALVCLDKNLNGACDADEPQARTDASGQATINVPATDSNSFPIVAMVGTDAVDADTGPVTTAYQLTAPADKPSVVSPLTTLVQTTITSNGIGRTQAEELLNARLPNVNFYVNYAARSTAEQVRAAAIGYALAEFQRVQLQVLAPALGTTDPTGATITQTDLLKAAQTYLLQEIDTLVSAADQALAGGSTLTPSTLQAIDASAAQAVSQNGGTPASVGGTLVPLRGSSSAEGEPSKAAGWLDMLQFTDAANWYFRAYVASASEVNAEGFATITHETRRRSLNGNVTSWIQSDTPDRDGDLHWNDSAWVDCSAGEPRTLLREVNGVRYINSTYCDGKARNLTQRTSVDIAGKRINDVLPLIYSNPSQASFVRSVPNASATFPAGSILQYGINTVLYQAPSYLPGSKQSIYPVNVGAGGDAGANPQLACNISAAQSSELLSLATSLEAMVASNPGKPCIYKPGFMTVDGNSYSSGDRNEWWSNSTVQWTSVGTASGTPGYYNEGVTRYRLGFPGGNTVTYYECKERTGGSVRNCDIKGSGTYAITSAGDARVMSFEGAPSAWAVIGWKRVYVERAGAVYTGYQNNLGVSENRRLNLIALNTLFETLGIPTLSP